MATEGKVLTERARRPTGTSIVVETAAEAPLALDTGHPDDVSCMPVITPAQLGLATLAGS